MDGCSAGRAISASPTPAHPDSLGPQRQPATSPATPRPQPAGPKDPARPARTGWPEMFRATNAASATTFDGSRRSAPPAGSIAARSGPPAAPAAEPPKPRRTPCDPRTAPRAESPGDGSLPPHSRNSPVGRRTSPGSPARRAACANTAHCGATHHKGSPRPEPRPPGPRRSVRAMRRNSRPEATSGTRDRLLSSCGNNESRRALQGPCQAPGGLCLRRRQENNWSRLRREMMGQAPDAPHGRG